MYVGMGCGVRGVQKKGVEWSTKTPTNRFSEVADLTEPEKGCEWAEPFGHDFEGGKPHQFLSWHSGRRDKNNDPGVPTSGTRATLENKRAAAAWVTSWPCSGGGAAVRRGPRWRREGPQRAQLPGNRPGGAEDRAVEWSGGWGEGRAPWGGPSRTGSRAAGGAGRCR